MTKRLLFPVLMGVMLLLLVAPVAAAEGTTLPQWEDTNIVQYVATEPDFYCPAVNPVTVNLVVNGCRHVISLPVLVGIGISLGETWDGINEHLNNFKTGLSNKFNNLISANKWIDANSDEAAAMLELEYQSELNGGGIGKKPDEDDDEKWYHKARWTPEGIKIKAERISKKEAAEELKKGRDIFTSKKELAKTVVNKTSKENYDRLVSKSKINPKSDKFEEIKDKNDLELHHAGQRGFYEHYHPKYQHTRPHCWFWKR